MGQYDFTHEIPEDFDKRVSQLLKQEPKGQQVLDAFRKCSYEFEDLGLAYYLGFNHGDYWEKHALDFTIEGNEANIELLKSNSALLEDTISKALRTSKTGFVLRDIRYLIDESEALPISDEKRFCIDIAAANSVLADLIKIGERLCSNNTYNKNSTENSINDFFRDTLSLMGYNEVKDQSRHGISNNMKEAGEVDILITKAGKEIAIFEGLKLNSVNVNYIDTHIEKAITNYNALGTATFIVAYVSAQDFGTFWKKYTEHIRNHPFSIDIKRELEIKATPNAAVRIADIILSRDGFDFPVYFMALKVSE